MLRIEWVNLILLSSIFGIYVNYLANLSESGNGISPHLMIAMRTILIKVINFFVAFACVWFWTEITSDDDTSIPCVWEWKPMANKQEGE